MASKEMEMFDSLFTVENLLNVLGTFVYLFGELFLLFVAISFFVALLQVWVSKDRIKRILSRPHKVTNAILGAALGAVTPFCSCSTIPVLVGLFKSGAPFSGAISFLMTSPILNPAIIALLLVFFGPVPTAVYAVITFAFAVCAGSCSTRSGSRATSRTLPLRVDAAGATRQHGRT